MSVKPALLFDFVIIANVMSSLLFSLSALLVLLEVFFVVVDLFKEPVFVDFHFFPLVFALDRYDFFHSACFKVSLPFFP